MKNQLSSEINCKKVTIQILYCFIIPFFSVNIQKESKNATTSIFYRIILNNHVFQNCFKNVCENVNGVLGMSYISIRVFIVRGVYAEDKLQYPKIPKCGNAEVKEGSILRGAFFRKNKIKERPFFLRY